jgi:hypothetical protein
LATAAVMRIIAAETSLAGGEARKTPGECHLPAYFAPLYSNHFLPTR